ncbi:hypothetical protein CRUP_029497 [Coryphaenoides rupestris]|nr:hypothetical protein CRUP_029497 [Coryphaenoides rupestris]
MCLQQANEALHHQHQVAQNSLLPLLNSGAEPIDQKPILPIQMDGKPPVSAAELLKDNVASGGGRHGPMPVVKKEQRSKTPFICGYCNKAFRDSYHLRRHESCHTGIKMVSRPKKTAQSAPTMVPMVSSMGNMIRESAPPQPQPNPSYISTMAGLLTTAPATTSVSSGSSIMTPSSMGNACTSAFATKDRLRSHMIRHEGKVTCNICGKMLSAAYITSHLKTHGQTNFNSCNKATPVSSVSAPITTTMNRGGGGNHPLTIAAQMNITTNTVSLHHPVTMVTGPVNIASVNIPSSGCMNLAHPVAITTPMPMPMNIGPLNIAMRSMESMPFLSQVLPSSPPW